MSPSDSLGVSWESLVGRLRASRALARWARFEPALAGLHDPVRLAQVVHDVDDPGRSDEILAALVRRAAGDGADGRDAAALVSLLLDNGSALLAIRLRDMSPDIDELIAGALWIQIRTFPCHRRRRAIGQSLLLDTRRAVLRELCPDRRRDGTRRVTPTSALELAVALPRATVAVSGSHNASGDDGVADLLDVLAWAHGNQVIAPSDVRLLIDLVAAAHHTDTSASVSRRGLNLAEDIDAVAARWGVCEKTVRRRRDRALRALRDARTAYLADVA